jgi:LPXTG-motif cell wall-anchored protein
MALVSFVVTLFINTGVQASQINSNLFVDEISISKTEISAGDNAEITIRFSEKNGHEFKPGDEMIFELPSELKGYKNEMLLEDYATVRVEEGRAIVTFTDKTTVKKNIKGMLSFSIKATDKLEAGTSKNVTLDLGTNIQKVPNVKVKGHDKRGPGEEPAPDFSYKGGFVSENDPTLINWYIVVNASPRYQMTGNVVVTDELGPGHEYVSSSFRFEGNDKMTAPEVKMDGKKFTVTLPEAYVSEHTIGIHYQTRLTEAGKKMIKLDNTFTTNYQVKNNRPNSISNKVSVNNVLMSGKIEGDDDLNKGTEETVDPMPEENTDEIAPIEPENGNEGENEKLEDSIHGSKEEIHVLPEEEVTPEENTDEIAPIEPENGSEGENEKLEDGINGSQEEIHVTPEEEVIPEENVDEIAPIEPDNGSESENEKLEDGINGSQEEIHVTPEEEVIDEGKIDTIDPITPENGNERTEENQLEDGIRGSQPEINVVPEEEIVPEEEVTPIKPNGTEKKTPKTTTKPAVKKTTTTTTNTTVAPKPVAPKKETTKVVAPKSVEKNVDVKAEQLPNTGSENNVAITVLGLLGMVFAGAMIVRRRK